MNLDRIGFKNWLEIKKLSQRTIENYLYYLDRFKLYEKFNQESTNDFILKFNQGIARAFINNYKQYIFENKKNLPLLKEDIETISEITLPKVTGRKKERIVEYITKLQIYEMEKVMSNERNKLMLLISFYAGLRLSGLLSLKPYDFYWTKWNLDTSKPLELKVIEKGDKERIVYIPSEVAFRLKSWISNVMSKIDGVTRESQLFQGKGGKVIGDRYWQKLVERSSRKALGIKISPHILRHSCGTYLLEMGWDLKEIKTYLGHQSITTTERYTHIENATLKQKFENI